MPPPTTAHLFFLGLCSQRGIGFDTLRKLGGPRGIARQLETDGGGTLEVSPGRVIGGEDLGDILEAGIRLYEDLDVRGCFLVGEDDLGYPSVFASMPDALRPQWFFAKGNLSLLERPGIAVVGTRSPTPKGTFLTQFASSVVRELMCPLISGLAIGVDSTAHEWSLQTFTPNISILGTGILRTYPAKNTELADHIVSEGGLLVSEYLPDASPNAESFVWRNRLQAAAAACVVAPEWKRSSGTAHTIRFAKRFGRPTVNLSLDGVLPESDHGIADRTFEVPSQYQELSAFLNKCLIDYDILPALTQRRLFG
ncbi:DNA-processing protein DprA [Xanthomonas fragariae]|uniref:Smf/DprA SLOG domain-containing protein n=1 Tax=Xanthomonas fragariae TaxID=48664 RepID=A0ABY1RUU3_9XANT|nr:DNA-processing protein DprA [Xanthomonas fragariae]WIY72361.1 DNA-processing protein DprA [Xanthomonas fragariae]SMR01076.1 hypothetical protein PD885_03857 [Xanthomonas fragariae]